MRKAENNEVSRVRTLWDSPVVQLRCTWRATFVVVERRIGHAAVTSRSVILLSLQCCFKDWLTLTCSNCRHPRRCHRCFDVDANLRLAVSDCRWPNCSDCPIVCFWSRHPSSSGISASPAAICPVYGCIRLADLSIQSLSQIVLFERGMCILSIVRGSPRAGLLSYTPFIFIRPSRAADSCWIFVFNSSIFWLSFFRLWFGGKSLKSSLPSAIAAFYDKFSVKHFEITLKLNDISQNGTETAVTSQC